MPWIVCLGLLLLGPAPLSACAMLAGAMADCTAAPAASAAANDCERMAMPQHPADQLESNLAPCCQLKAPLPEAVESTTKVVRANLAVQDLPAKSVAAVRPALYFPVSSLPVSPPERQSLFCVFLI